MLLSAIDDPAREAAYAVRGVEVERVRVGAGGHVDLPAVLRALGKRGVTRIFSEGGPKVGSALITQGLADEVVMFSGVKPFGGRGVPALDEAARKKLGDIRRFELLDDGYVGLDRVRYYERVG